MACTHLRSGGDCRSGQRPCRRTPSSSPSHSSRPPAPQTGLSTHLHFAFEPRNRISKCRQSTRKLTAYTRINMSTMNTCTLAITHPWLFFHPACRVRSPCANLLDRLAYRFVRVSECCQVLDRLLEAWCKSCGIGWQRRKSISGGHSGLRSPGISSAARHPTCIDPIILQIMSMAPDAKQNNAG